jgi:hypothetical protein
MAAPFGGDGGADAEDIGRAGNEPVGSVALDNGDCEGDFAACVGGAGVRPGAALGTVLLGAALFVAALFGAVLFGAVIVGAIGVAALGATGGCAAVSLVGAGSAGEFCDGFPPAPGTTSAALDAGAISGVGPGVVAGDGSALPTGCADPLCGCGAFGLI